MAMMNGVSDKQKPTQRNAGDEVIDVFNEMRSLLRMAYERTGDLSIRPVIERADKAMLSLRGMKVR